MKPVITIHYCPKCNWLLRAAYMAQELLTTFNNDVQGVMLQPSDTNGRFTVLVDNQIVFDRKQFGGFIEIKKMKQIIRDQVNPTKNLGHADKTISDNS